MMLRSLSDSAEEGEKKIKKVVHQLPSSHQLNDTALGATGRTCRASVIRIDSRDRMLWRSVIEHDMSIPVVSRQ